MSKIGTYFKESYTELTQKVAWPDWSSLQNSAIVVMVASLILALVIFLVDLAFRSMMTGIYGLLY
ncbi:MAG: preprotein translocase subunit SecE [Alistipes sp.]|nr:preprotein translocase subunit SecE [Candidatus Minthomonas equi]